MKVVEKSPKLASFVKTVGKFTQLMYSVKINIVVYVLTRFVATILDRIY